MTTETTPPRTLGAVMSSEAGYEADVDDAPLRISGFVALLLSLLSGFTIVALPMVGFAIAAVLFGMFALRKSDSQSLPVGTTAARIAIVLAVLFGTWGVGRYSLKRNTLGGQAEYFARQFVRVASSGNEIYAKELQKSYVNRYLKTMPLEETYELERLKMERKMKEARERGEEVSPPGDEDSSTVTDLVKYPVDQEWVLWRPVRVFSHYGRQKAEVVLATDHTEKAYKLRIVLEYMIHKDRGTAEWYIETCLPYRDRIVAESVL
ncbi:hypothetical protein NZK35_06235 [Stieleria sp. ICT_E10.1]|uniref:hypothetical protein n=1 Tax=Stieleria sedimenti TaxID=2976331 RepID=UPI00217F2B23|nr:hypothetical protein [Stieleria sedimenti]MCS7466273.1 hypothetical protein [Stieleria sedimenti]